MEVHIKRNSCSNNEHVKEYYLYHGFHDWKLISIKMDYLALSIKVCNFLKNLHTFIDKAISIIKIFAIIWHNLTFYFNNTMNFNFYRFFGEKKNSTNAQLSISAVLQGLYLFQYKTIFEFSFARFCIFSV